MNVNIISSGIVRLLQVLFNTCAGFWGFLTQPLFTIDLTVLPEWLLDILFPLLPDFVFAHPFDISLLFVVSVAGIFLFLWFKIVTLLNPLG